ncbi:MAG: serine hydroxymethyltransferase [Polyangia bacterium]|jgi:glycine cleavage system T protein|nr:serine hydroxymethyltransferase [Polyangia bacterium]
MTPTPRVALSPLEQLDPFVHRLCQFERDRQSRKLIMIASESICPRPVREAMLSEFANIYAEGYPSPRMNELDEAALEAFDGTFVEFRRYGDRRYYKGCDYVNLVEALAKRRAAQAFANERVPQDRIFANVQPLSGAAANNAVYNAFLKPGDCIMGMDLTCGGHLTHGSEVNRSGRTYRIAAYRPGKDGRLDYEAMARLAREWRPALLVAGFSAYPWDIDWAALRAVCDQVGAILHADIAHTAGLVAAGVLSSPVGYADVISFTTHKSLCGPRGAAILTTDPAHAARVDLGVFPGEQGGPHIHQITAKAVAFGLARSETHRALMKDVLENAAALAGAFLERGAKLAYGGTNTHLCLLDLKSLRSASGQPLTGEIAARVLDMLGLTVNKNTIMGDTSATQPTGLRFGTVWVTQRGLGPEHMVRIAEVVLRVLRGTHAFEYLYGGGAVGRGKLDWPLWEEARAELASLADEAADASPGDGSASAYPHQVTLEAPSGSRPTPLGEAHARAGALLGERAGWRVPLRFGDVETEVKAARESCALWDLGDASAIRVEGARAEKLLQCSLTVDLLRLGANRCAAGLFLDRQGAPIDLVTVARLSQPVREPDNFLVITRGGQGPRVATWLRAISDGYVLQDEDIFRKAEGPAVVQILADQTSVSLIGLGGPNAPAVLGKAIPALAKMEPGELRQDGDLLAVQSPGVGKEIALIAPAEQVQVIWTRLLEAGATPIGTEALDRLSKEAKLPTTGSPEPAGADLGRCLPAELLCVSKPWFVGQEAVVAGTATTSAPPPEHDFSKPELPLRRTCLYGEHLKLTKKKFIVPFAGWEMPVWYEGIGAEHRAVRLGAGLFDVSHMGVLRVQGRHAERFLDLMTTNYVPWLKPGQCHYSYLLGPDGRVIDDIIVYREGADRFMVVINAANAEVDEAWLRAALTGKVCLDPAAPARRLDVDPGEVQLLDMKLDESLGEERRVDLALQGPASLPTLLRLAKDADFARRLRELGRFTLTAGLLEDLPVVIAGTGYTGEDVGYEIFVHPERAPKLWNLILDTGRDLGVRPAGLGARDSTRTEAGLPLHGHELAGAHGVNPLEAGYAPFVRMHKPWFVGRAAMAAALAARDREIVRFQVTPVGAKKVNPGNKVLDGKRGRYIGFVTSSVTIGRTQIGLALVDRRYSKVGEALAIFPRSERDKDPSPKPLSELGPGDELPLAVEASILARFAKPSDLHGFAAALAPTEEE